MDASQPPLLHRLVMNAMPLVPTSVMRRIAARYIAGETLEEALAKLEELRGRGFSGILDLLGEDVKREVAAREVADRYREGARRIAERGLDAYVSIKPTHLGLRISESLCLELYRCVATRCKELGLWVRVEMEDRTTTDATLRVFEALRADFDNVGIVLQSRLFRTPDDVAALAPGPLSVRVVKGVYLEPASIAHTEPEPIRDAYVALCRQLFERGAHLSFATHDDGLAARLLALVHEMGVGLERYELQVLLGVREPLWESWRAGGHPVRVYVPYGPDWRAYSQRRLQKNPEMLGHVMRATLRMG